MMSLPAKTCRDSSQENRAPLANSACKRKRGYAPTARRRGTTMLEVVSATVLMTAMAGLLGEGMVMVQTQRSTIVRRQVAQFEVADEMQRIAALSWNELTIFSGGNAPLSDTAKESLPQARMITRVETLAGEADARRITVELHWMGPLSGQPEAPVRLVSWAYKNGRRPMP
jgi:hypothetical protein